MKTFKHFLMRENYLKLLNTIVCKKLISTKKVDTSKLKGCATVDIIIIAW